MDSSNVPPPGSRPIKEPKRRLNRGLSSQGSSSSMFNAMNQPSFGNAPSTASGSMPTFGQQPQQQQQPFAFNQQPAASQQPQSPSFQPQQQAGGFGGGQMNSTPSFNFGAPSMPSAQSTPSSPGFTFGNQTPNTGFNVNMQQQQQPSGMGGFGTSQSSLPFGGQPTQTASSPFGAPSGFGTQLPTSSVQQPSSTPASGFSFGGTSQGTATAPATATTPAFGTSFSGGSGFGEQPKTPSAFSFDNTASQPSAASPFGTDAQQPQKQLSFGGFGGSTAFTANQPQSEPAQQPSSPFLSSSAPADTSSTSFGNQAQKTAPSPFGGIGSPSSTSMTFGSTPKKDTEEKKEGDKATTTPAFSFGSSVDNKASTDQSKPSFSFGSTTGTTATAGQPKPSFSFGTTTGTATTSDQPKPSFAFGSTTGTTATSDQPKPSFSFGTTNATGQKRRGTDLESSEPSKSRPFQFTSPSGDSGIKSQPSFGSTDRKDDKKEDSTKDMEDGSTEKEVQPSGKDTATTPSFSFGQPSTTPQATETPTFSFGTPTQKPATEKTDDKAKTSSPPATAPSFAFNKESTGGFSFGTPQKSQDTTTEKAPSFSFGATNQKSTADTTTEKAPSFSFGTTPQTSTADTTSDKTPSFSFGTSATKSTTDSSNEKAPSFSFGTPTAQPITEKSTEKAPTFSFGTSAQTKSTDTSTEKTTTEATETPAEKKPATSFSFGTPATQKPSTETTGAEKPTTTGFSFGTPAQKSSTESNATTADKPATGFSFGTPSPATSTDTSASKTPAAFSFGTPSTNTATSKPGGFTLGTATQPTQTDSTTSKAPAAFSFGTPSTAATKAPATFSFGTPAQTTPTDTSAPKKPPVFSFGTSSQTSSADTSVSSTPATFSFGTASKDTTTEKAVPSSTPTFSFGGASTTTKPSNEPQVKPLNAFNFGTKPSADSETATGQKRKGGDIETGQPTKMPSFQFNPKATLASTTNDQQKDTATNKSTDVTPSSTEESEKGNKAVTFKLPEVPKSVSTHPSTKEADKPSTSPFSVSKPSVSTSAATTTTIPAKPVVTKPEDTFKPLIPKDTTPITLSSTATPAKSILKSSSTSKDTFGPSATTTTVQTTVQSSITNAEQIEKSTRYAQLPVDAQNALLEAEQFINGQQLFSRNIKTRIDAFGGEDILHVNTQVSELLNDVNALKEQLQAQSFMITRVGTDIKQQMDATAINKAIVDSRYTRRIAGSGDHQRYFAELYEKLRNQLGEFESAVGQIEQRLQEEMSAGRSPQDLGALISSQNQLFLSLSGKASELHQRVQSLLPPHHQQQQPQPQSKQDTTMTNARAVTGL